MNKKILESNPAERDLFDILVLSNNSPESGTRIINSAKHYGKGDPSPMVPDSPGRLQSRSGTTVDHQWQTESHGIQGEGGKGFSWSPASFSHVLHTKKSGSILHGPGTFRQLLEIKTVLKKNHLKSQSAVMRNAHLGDGWREYLTALCSFIGATTCQEDAARTQAGSPHTSGKFIALSSCSRKAHQDPRRVSGAVRRMLLHKTSLTSLVLKAWRSPSSASSVTRTPHST